MSDETKAESDAIGGFLKDVAAIAREEKAAALAEFSPEDKAAMERAAKGYVRLLGKVLKDGWNAETKREAEHFEFQAAAWKFKAGGVASRIFWRAAERVAKRAGQAALALAVRAGKLAVGLPL